jgi:hypothetical protein
MYNLKSLSKAACMLQSHVLRESSIGACRQYSRSSLTYKDNASSTGFVSMVRGAIAKMKLVSNGIKTFTMEFKEIRVLREVKGAETPGTNVGTFYNEKWLRKEIIMAKRVSAAKVRVALTAAVFAIPGGGFVVVGVLLGYPQFLTTHFWDDKMKEEFKQSEYANKFHLQTVVKLAGQGRLSQNILKNPSLDEGQRSILRELAAYHGVINSHLNKSAPFILENMIVSPWIQLRLLEKFEGLLADDILILRDSPNVEELTRDELQEACVERMLCSPNLSNANMRVRLDEWMHMDASQKMEFFLLNTVKLPM